MATKMSTTLTGAKRRRAKQATPALAKMSVEDFMADFGDSDDDGSKFTPTHDSKKRKLKQSESARASSCSLASSLTKLASTDPEFYQFLQENDEELLQFSENESVESDAGDGVESGAGDGVEGDAGDSVESDGSDASDGVQESDDDVGVPEPRPLHVTSRREALVESDQENSVSDDPGAESEDGVISEENGDVAGRLLTQAMIRKWVDSIEQTHSLKSLKQLTLALHSAIAQMLHSDTEVVSMPTYRVESSRVFNQLVISCLKQVEPCLAAHVPATEGRSGQLSKHKAWPKAKRIVKPYLSDLLSLITNLRDPAMQCAVIRSVRPLAPYLVCLSKMCRSVEKELVRSWAAGEHHVQVMAFLALREITLLKPHPSLSDTLKKLYMAFVRNSKFISSESLPRVRFMQNCLVELLSVDTPTTYQLGFVYIRQLAIHLRAAITSGKKDAQQAVYNWQFVHCLDLWGQVLGHVTDASLRPLVYPLVQVLLSTVSLQPSARYYPLRLHLIRTLIQLGKNTDIFIPTAPLLLEVLESYGTNASSRLQTGKPPELSLLLRATKTHLQSRAYQSAVLNCCFEQLLEFSAAHSHLIGYPELMFPVTTRIRKVAKTTPYSWLRLQLQQLLGKVDEVATATEREREKVDFSPSHSDKISAWECARRGQENAVTKFRSTWTNIHQTKETAKPSVVKNKPHPPSDEEMSEEASEGLVSDNSEDLVEDFDLSSADSD